MDQLSTPDGEEQASIIKRLTGLGRQIEVLRAELLDAAHLKRSTHHFSRNTLPNDSALTQKIVINQWKSERNSRLTYFDLLDSGFRVFSQSDEDGIILRIFSQIGVANRFVVEIGSNCAGSEIDIPENLSTNLIINHGWSGKIIEMDEAECKRMQYFFAQEPATRHFHWVNEAGQLSYYSPEIIRARVQAENALALVENKNTEPDLLVIDVDSIDYKIADALETIRPRVIVVEFERRFRDRHSVVLRESRPSPLTWPLSGSTSLRAWCRLFDQRKYSLCVISMAGFNAFFVRNDLIANKIEPITVSQAFDQHPILSKLPESFWKDPDDNWYQV